MSRFVSSLFIAFVGVTLAANEVWLNIAPRFQWGNNAGYCGEVSLISAGLSFGQYLSQYDSRAAACGTKAQNRCEMLLGMNDEAAAANMHFTSTEWNTVAERSTSDYLVWIKKNILEGNLVIMGVFMNEYIFYNDADPSAGDADYDHIVPVIGITSNHPLTDTTTYYPDDVIHFSDNGLYGVGEKIPYVFNYTFSEFQATRKQANAKDGAVYSLPNTASNYGLVVTGLKDTNKELIAVRVDTSVNYENPEIGKNSDTRPVSMPLSLTVTVTNTATDGTTNFILYKYNKLSAVPESNFNKNAGNAIQQWNVTLAKGETYVLTDNIQSSDVAVYRAAKA